MNNRCRHADELTPKIQTEKNEFSTHTVLQVHRAEEQCNTDGLGIIILGFYPNTPNTSTCISVTLSAKIKAKSNKVKPGSIVKEINNMV